MLGAHLMACALTRRDLCLARRCLMSRRKRRLTRVSRQLLCSSRLWVLSSAHYDEREVETLAATSHVPWLKEKTGPNSGFPTRIRYCNSSMQWFLGEIGCREGSRGCWPATR